MVLANAVNSVQVPLSLAYDSDIPGTRCGPEDGPWPRSYQVLDEPDIWREMSAFAKPQSIMLNPIRGWRADAINFQPCLTSRTQDRYIVQQLDIHGLTWTLTGVFDGPCSPLLISDGTIMIQIRSGHLGDVTVEHTAHHLPIIIRDFLREAYAQKPSRPVTPAFISDLLSRSMTSFDKAIADDVMDLFPGGLESLAALSDENIQHIINDFHHGGANYQKARLCMYGTTALVALVDPDHENLWLANLGDCQAGMLSQSALLFQ
jgi:pyruvate dehydrogenase phosphatase